jgi:hypothetical protein
LNFPEGKKKNSTPKFKEKKTERKKKFVTNNPLFLPSVFRSFPFSLFSPLLSHFTFSAVITSNSSSFFFFS